MGKRCVDLEGLARLHLLLLLGHPPQRSHVVKPVRQLDDEDPNISGHRHNHLAHCLGRRGLAVLDTVKLRHAVNELSDLVAEILAKRINRVAGVLDRIVQERGREGRCTHAEVSEDRRDREGVGDVRLAAAASLVTMQVGRGLIGPLDDLGVALRVVLPKRPKERLELRMLPARPGKSRDA